MDTLTVRLQTVTPLFLGGARPDDHAELRAASIKGALRYWYRALDAGYALNERRHFGDASEAKSPAVIRLGFRQGTEQWDSDRYTEPWQDALAGGAQRVPGFRRPGNRGAKHPYPRNGIMYLGFSLNSNPNHRKAIPAGTTFELRIIFRPGQDTAERRQAWLAAIWLLAHLGGLGTRSHRGLGSLRIMSWQGWDAECAVLPICSDVSPEAWRDGLQTGLTQLRQWFPAAPPNDHAVLDSNGRIYLLRHGERDWERALDQAGLLLQDFRQLGGPWIGGHPGPGNMDYAQVREHLKWRASNGATGTRLTASPERAEFGLPLIFRYQSLGGDTITFAGEEHNRQSSPLWIRIVRIAGPGQPRYHPLFFRLSGPVLRPAPTSPAPDTTAPRPPEAVTDQKTRDAFGPPLLGAVDRFLQAVVAGHSFPAVTP